MEIKMNPDGSFSFVTDTTEQAIEMLHKLKNGTTRKPVTHVIATPDDKPSGMGDDDLRTMLRACGYKQVHPITLAAFRYLVHSMPRERTVAQIAKAIKSDSPTASHLLQTMHKRNAIVHVARGVYKAS